MQFTDLSLLGILESLAAEAWSKPSLDPSGAFLLPSAGLWRDSSPQGLGRTLRTFYEHARTWAPGFDVPTFVPPILIANPKSHAGVFGVDAENYGTITVSTEFLTSVEATLLILAHEACHHILLQSGLSYQFKNDVPVNERITDLAMFVCGFGEIVQRGHSVVKRSGGRLTSIHLGYLPSDEYESAHRYVLAKRVAAHLPGTPKPKKKSLMTDLRKWFKDRLTPFKKATASSNLLKQVIKNTDSQRRHQR